MAECRRWLGGGLWGVVLALGAVHCGGAAMAPAGGKAPTSSPASEDSATPSAPPAPPPASFAQPGYPQGAPVPSPTAGAATAPADGDMARRRAAARAELDAAQSDLQAAASDCATACRALASMERATKHLCDLAGEPDDQARCDDARRRLVSARDRIRSSCGACP
jgi:hypothetical protein